jgi:hypothetical protein
VGTGIGRIEGTCVGCIVGKGVGICVGIGVVTAKPPMARNHSKYNVEK